MTKKKTVLHKIKNKKKNNHGHHVIKKHHSKPYRKRHYSTLVILIVSFVILVSYAAVYRDRVNSATKSAQNYISSLFRREASISTVSSSFGFSISYDDKKFYAGAVDTVSGDLFFGDELDNKRSYDQVRFSKSQVGDLFEQGSMTVKYYPEESLSSNEDPKILELEMNELKGRNAEVIQSLNKNNQSKITLDGYEFVKTEWTIKSPVLNNQLAANIVTFRGVIDLKPMVIKIAYGLTGSDGYKDYIEIVNSIRFTDSQPLVLNQKADNYQYKSSSERLMNLVLFTSVAKAQSASNVSNTELLAAKYSPAVVQIWNYFCMDISINGLLFYPDACSAGQGSGFIVGSNGYIATNGHVASSDTKDILIIDAIVQYTEFGDDRYLVYLIQQAGITEREVLLISDPIEQLDFIIDKLYGIEDSKISVSNQVSNLLVLLNEKAPDFKEVLELTEKRKEFTEQDYVKRAKIEAVDYKAFDGIVKWRASDVAIIKIEGQNYPIVKTGTLDNLAQGAEIFILGYPGLAGENGLVENTQIKATLTSGKVSAVKNAKGSNKKIVETDTTIGSGNSGGPAFDSEGRVIGLATYTVDGAGQNLGIYNYIRDIKDLLDVAKNKSLTFNLESTTQSRWEEGLDLFYKARYSKSVKVFEEVKKNYPQHPKVDQFIASANEKIKNGLDVKDTPYALIITGVAFVAIGIMLTVIIIRRQKHKHGIYMQHVASNAGINPFANTNIRSIQVAPNTLNGNAFNNQLPSNPIPNQVPGMGVAPQPQSPQSTPTPYVNPAVSAPVNPTVQPNPVKINPVAYPSAQQNNQPGVNNQNISPPNQGT